MHRDPDRFGFSALALRFGRLRSAILASRDRSEQPDLTQALDVLKGIHDGSGGTLPRVAVHLAEASRAAIAAERWESLWRSLASENRDRTVELVLGILAELQSWANGQGGQRPPRDGVACEAILTF